MFKYNFKMPFITECLVRGFYIYFQPKCKIAFDEDIQPIIFEIPQAPFLVHNRKANLSVREPTVVFSFNHLASKWQYSQDRRCFAAIISHILPQIPFNVPQYVLVSIDVSYKGFQETSNVSEMYSSQT